MKQTQPASSTPKKSQTAHASASHSHIKRPIIGSRHYDAGHRLWSLWHTRGLTLMWRACQCDMTRRVSMYFYGLFAAVGWCSTLETAPQDCLLHCLPLCSYAGTWTRSPFYSLLEVDAVDKIYWPFFLYTWQDSCDTLYRHKWGGLEFLCQLERHIRLTVFALMKFPVLGKDTGIHFVADRKCQIKNRLLAWSGKLLDARTQILKVMNFSILDTDNLPSHE